MGNPRCTLATDKPSYIIHKISIPIASFVLPLLLWSQALDIPELEIIGDAVYLEYSFNAVVNKDGEPSVAIKIISNLDDLAYESNNGVIKVDRKTPGQDIVYLSLDERLLTIHHKGFKPKKVILRQLGIKATPRSMWKIEVSGHKREGLNKKRGTITVRSTPPNAKISISGLPDFEENTPNTFSDYIAQSYQIMLSKQYFDDIDTVMVIGEGNNPPMDLTLKTTNAGLIIKSLPTGAMAYLGDTYLGKTPITLLSPDERITPGEYDLRIEHSPFYKETVQTITLSANSVLTKDISLDDLSGYITLIGNSFPVTVKINETKHTHVQFGDQIRLPQGDYIVTIMKEGEDKDYYASKQIIQSIHPKSNHDIDATLVNESTWVQIGTANTKLDLLINDIPYINMTVGDKILLTAGSYNIVGSKNGVHKQSYEQRSYNVVLEAGSTQLLDFNLRRFTGTVSVTTNLKESQITIIDREASEVVYKGRIVNNAPLLTGEYEIFSEHPKFGDSPSKRISILNGKNTSVSLNHSRIESLEWKRKRAQGMYNPKSLMFKFSNYRNAEYTHPLDSSTYSIKADERLFGVEQTITRVIGRLGPPSDTAAICLYAIDEFSFLYSNSSITLYSLRMLGIGIEMHLTTSSTQMSSYVRMDLHRLQVNQSLNIQGQEYLLLSTRGGINPKYSLSNISYPVIMDIGMRYVYTPQWSKMFSIGVAFGIEMNLSLREYNYYNKSQYITWKSSESNDKYLEGNLPEPLNTTSNLLPTPMANNLKYIELYWVFDL